MSHPALHGLRERLVGLPYVKRILLIDEAEGRANAVLSAGRQDVLDATIVLEELRDLKAAQIPDGVAA